MASTPESRARNRRYDAGLSKRTPKDRGGKEPREGWQERFLDGLASTQMLTEAVKLSGVSRAYLYQQRKLDPEFASKWEEIYERSTDILEQIAVRRAAEGSDVLLIFLLKARRPHIYRDNVRIEHEHQFNSGVPMLDGRQPIQVDSQNRREAARLLLESHNMDTNTVEGTATEINEVKEDNG